VYVIEDLHTRRDKTGIEGKHTLTWLNSWKEGEKIPSEFMNDEQDKYFRDNVGRIDFPIKNTRTSGRPRKNVKIGFRYACLGEIWKNDS